MKSAPSVLPEEPPGDPTSGIDWARDDHALAIVDARGRQVHRCVIEHSAAGIRTLLGVLNKHGVGEVAIERPDGPVVDTLLEAGLTVVVISPNQLKNLRGRYGSAGNEDDRFDAFVLADTLRTDRARLRPLIPDTPATLALRRACRARKDLVSHRVGVANQLREHLKRVLPGTVGLFAEIDSPISLAFLTRFDCQERADWLSHSPQPRLHLPAVSENPRRRPFAAPLAARYLPGSPVGVPNRQGSIGEDEQGDHEVRPDLRRAGRDPARSRLRVRRVPPGPGLSPAESPTAVRCGRRA
ncbi:transposase [Prauserella shujinwangii]|uniref:Transposase n=1 Tax=Prauserella shujinwangii TaxID=1453103 RepID=A0A2T0LTI1_9PSEU|nr:transposase [Prauserella shujinwangii]